MGAEPSKVRTAEGRTAGRRREVARERARQKRRRAFLERLEERCLLAVVPPALVSSQVVPGPVAAEPSDSNSSSPSIAVDPTNPNHIAMVWQNRDPVPGTPPVAYSIHGAFSADGGQNWVSFQPVTSVLPDPTTSNPTVPYTRVTDGTVDFDRNGNFYVLVSQHNDSNASGVLVLSKFSSSGGGVTNVFRNKVIYGWTQDQALKPTLAVDKGVASFTDVDGNGQTVTQTNSYTGAVYIAWATVDTIPTGNPANWNPNTVRIVGSADGGQNFSAPRTVGFGNFGSQRETAPRIIVSQGTATAGGQPVRVAGGLVTVVYDDFGSGANASPTPFDNLNTRTYTGIQTQSFTSTTGPIADAGPSNAPTTTTFTFNVPAGTVLNVNDLSVALNLTHPALQELTIQLQAPDGTIVNLVNNNTATGANLGYGSIPTIFTDSAPKGMGAGPAAPYLGLINPAGNLGVFNGPLQTGTWRLLVTDSTTNNTGTLTQARLVFSGDFVPGSVTTAARSIVRGQQGAGGLVSTPSMPQGIGPAPDLASDNTLGAFSQYQGRIYLTYVGRYDPNSGATGNPADNTDIFLVASDDAGRTWVPLGKINDDDAVTDGFSSAADGDAGAGQFSGRPQYQPQIDVDQANGMVVVSYFDTRYDSTRARVATSLQASIDGGASFSTSTYANQKLTVQDQATGQIVTLGPIPDNMSSGNTMANKDAEFGFGDRQGLAVLAGHVYPAWSSNLNGGNAGTQLLQIRVGRATFAAGPRLISGSSGAIGLDSNGNQLSNLPLNQTTTADGTPIAQAFTVQFDRPVDPSTFDPTDVQMFFHDTVAGSPAVPVTVLSVVPQNPGVFGATDFLVTFTPSSAVGTYSYSVGSQISDRYRSTISTVSDVGGRVQAPSTDTPIAIVDGNTITSSLTLSGYPVNQVMSNVRVNLTLTHTFDSDLRITLIAPDGTRVVLSNRAGGAGQNFIGTIFDDSAATPISSGTAPFTGPFRPEQSLSNVVGKAINGIWRLEVADLALLDVGSLVSWALDFQPGVATSSASSGNLVDQNGNAVPGETVDFLAMPTPTGTSPFTAPFVRDTLPIVIPGPHVIGSTVQNEVPGSSDNLVRNNTASYLDVTFDRDMDAATFDGSKVLRIQGPAGLVAGPYTVVPLTLGGVEVPGAAVARSFRIKFPTQTLSGTYTVDLASDIKSVGGHAIDDNLNAGVDVLRGTPSLPPVTLAYPSSPLPVPIQAQKTAVSTLQVNDDFLIQGLTVTVNVTFPVVSDLTLTLIAPDGTRILLASGVGATAPFANFTNTVFDDTATTPISNGGPPFFGRFITQSGQLTTLVGTSTVKGPGGSGTGVWQLEVVNAGTRVGSIGAWTMTFQKAVPSSGLGEAVADRSALAFRIFTMDPTNPLASTTWTSMGPAAIGGGTYSSRIGGLAIDPSDPSGNTVYVAGASGGVWKTTNFLTHDPVGPTYIPLTDFGPTFGINIGGIAVFGRNNDPRQSVVFVATGEGDTGTSGVGMLRSMDGGATWTLLDSTDNRLPFAQRDHAFLGSTSFNIVVDPRPTPSGDVIVYAALSGNNGGIWRSLDSGQTWGVVDANGVRVANLPGQATDVTLDPTSGPIDAVANPTGNLQKVYGAIRGQGVYLSPNQGQLWNIMAGGIGNPLQRDADPPPGGGPPIPVSNSAVSPNGPKGRIVLAKPALIPSTVPNSTLKNFVYSGWLYAYVATPDNFQDGLYVTKDNGQNWTKVRIPTLPAVNESKRAVPTNDTSLADYDVLGDPDGLGGQGNYDIAMTIDPTNPNVVYLGGFGSQVVGMVRVDITGLSDPHAFYMGNDRTDGGTLTVNSTDTVGLKQNPLPGVSGRDPRKPGGPTGAMINMNRNPANPLGGNGTFFVSNTASIANSGAGARWIPWNYTAGDVHRMISMVDPLTGLSRVIVGDDHGIFTVVDNPDGTISGGIGTQLTAPITRSGNLQINQFYYGAVQPSSAAAQIAQALFYGQAQDNGSQESAANILSTGNIGWGGPLGDGAGVATDQTGSGTAYRYNWPCCGGNNTDFFQVLLPGGAVVGRTNGLLLSSGTGQVPDPTQWPNLGGFNFGVNPINGDQILISSALGRVFRTLDQGRNWFSIAEPSVLDGTNAEALTFGAPDPGAISPGSLANFIYAGTNGGHIFVSFTGGGSGAGNNWIDISAGLDGSGVRVIVANPTRGSHEAYAVTRGGVYYMADSSATGATWQNITGNLFQILHTPFDDPRLVDPISGVSDKLQYLASIQADWRYVIPDNPAQPNGPTHPMLYVAGNGGVYRSSDKGATWTKFPLLVEPGSLDTTAGLQIPGGNGGGLPNADIRDLDMSIGNVDPTTGRAIAQAGDPNILVATTYGRGTFAIRLAPVVFANSVGLDPSLPAPGGSDKGGTAPDGTPIVDIAQPYFEGLSAQTAFGNRARITLWDLTDELAGTGPRRLVGGYDPSNGATDVAANWTDSFGKFSVQINPNAFTVAGLKTIGIQATDLSGTRGNMALMKITLTNISPPPINTAPIPPTITMLPADDTSGGAFVTKNNQPHIIGVTSPGVTVNLYFSNNAVPPLPIGGVLGTATSDAAGNYSVQFASTLADGVYYVQTVASNIYGATASNTAFRFEVKNTAPTTPPTLGLLPADDTGIVGDWVTSNRSARFNGVAEPGARVQLYRVIGGNRGPVLATTTADVVTGAYTIKMPSALANGTITIQTGETDLAGNPGPYSNLATIRVVTTLADYTGEGATDPALVRRNANGSLVWLIQGVPPASGTVFGQAATDIPFTGDFDGDGKSDLAIYRPSTNTWDIQRSLLGRSTFNLGGPSDIPVVGDFDGDGITDVGLYTPAPPTGTNPNAGKWTIAESTVGVVVLGPLAGVVPTAGDVPVPGDYKGAGNTQIAIYRPSSGTFFHVDASNSLASPVVSTGSPGDVPVPGDYFNSFTVLLGQPVPDRRTIPAVFNPTTATYLVLGHAPLAFQPGDVPAPGDYARPGQPTGTGSLQPVVFRPSDHTFRDASGTVLATFGQAGDTPVTAPPTYRNPITQPTLALSASADTGFLGDNRTAGFWQNGWRFITLEGKADPGALVDLINTNVVPPFTINTVQADALGNYSISVAGFFNGTYGLQARAHGLSGTSSPPSAILPVTLVTVAGDFTGGGKTDQGVFSRAGANLGWLIAGLTSSNPLAFGSSVLDVPVPGDFDADGRADLIRYRPSTGEWFGMRSAFGYQPELLGTWGWPGVDVPVPADYNGDGMTDFATYRPNAGTGSDGTWSIAYNYVGGTKFVSSITPSAPRATDVPVPADYNGDGIDDVAIYRPAQAAGGVSTWYIKDTADVRAVLYGTVGDVPVPGGYDATPTNRALEVSVFRPSTGQWFIKTGAVTERVLQFAAGDIPAPGDYDGNGVTDPVVFRPSTGQWLTVLTGSNTAVPVPPSYGLPTFGGAGSVPLNAPYQYRKLPGGSGSGIGALSVAAPAAPAGGAGFDLGSSARGFSTGSTATSNGQAPASSSTKQVDLSAPTKRKQPTPVDTARADRLAQARARIASLFDLAAHRKPGRSS